DHSLSQAEAVPHGTCRAVRERSACMIFQLRRWLLQLLSRSFRTLQSAPSRLADRLKILCS
ncbi:MAG TPA: hypothetical protein VF935_05925, partial [Candidatus Acidoferrum sp.]